MKTTILKLFAVVLAIACIAFLLITAGAWTFVQYQICCGVEIANAEASSPFGTPETLEEIRENVRNSFADSNFFLKLASGNFSGEETLFYIIIMAFLLLVALFLLYLLEQKRKDEERYKRREESERKFHDEMEKLGAWNPESQ